MLGYGFALPYLRPYLGRSGTRRGGHAGAAGCHRLAAVQRSLTVLSEEDALPFPDAFFDRILVVHGLEGAEATRPMLRQLWRVLAPEDGSCSIAPNRASLWAQLERSPFALGRPFSRGQLDRLLAQVVVRAAALGPRAVSSAAAGPQAGAHRDRVGAQSRDVCAATRPACILSMRKIVLRRLARPVGRRRGNGIRCAQCRRPAFQAFLVLRNMKVPS